MNKERLKQLRKAADLTQVEMADELGLARRLYQKYESGDTPIRKVVALAAEHVLLCNPRPHRKARDCHD